MPAHDDLSRGFAVLGGKLANDGLLEDDLVVATAERIPGLKHDAVLVQQRLELGLREVGVALHLDKGGHNLAVGEQILDLGLIEVGDADGAQLACLVGCLELGVAGHVITCGLVKDHKVDVIAAQTLKRFVHGGVGLIEARPELGLEEDLLARAAGVAHAAAHGTLVDVGVGRIDKLVAVVQGVGDGRLRIIGRKQVRAQAHLGHLDVVVEGDVVHGCSFLVIV